MSYNSINDVSLNKTKIPDPMTITFYAVDGQENDVIQTLFGEGQFAMHSCGRKEFEGF